MKEYIINILELIIMTDENLSQDTLPAPSYNYRCNDCGKVFPNAKQLTHHYRMDHPEGL
jgi:hypothetical protein